MAEPNGANMTDTAVETRSWSEFKSAEEANAEYKLLPEDSGYVLRLDAVDDPTKSPFQEVDEHGKPKPPAWQTKITFTVVDYINDDEENTMIGQQIKQFFKISMHTKSNFYKLVKAVFGGDIDPTWKPNSADLRGRVVSAVIAHKEPNDQGQIYPKVASYVPYRGRKTFDDVVAARRPSDDTADVPF